jgi:hypothetical protein
MDGTCERDELAGRIDDWARSQGVAERPSRAHLDEKLCKLATLGLLIA